MRRIQSMTQISRRTSSVQGRLAAVAVKEMMALHQEARLLNPSGNQPKWSHIMRVHWTDYVALAVLITLWFIMEEMQPFYRVIYATTDEQTWRLSYPLKPNTVPAVAVPALAAGGPLLVFIAYYFAFKCSRLEFHNVVVGMLTNVFCCAAVTNFIKLNVGRPRPDFMMRCWPGGEVKWEVSGLPACEGGLHSVAEGLKSFPSGHTAWSASGLGFLAFFLLGKSKAFDGSGHPARIVLGGMPLLMALWIGMTRMQDYWHHWEDVAVGYCLGAGLAYCFYRSLYPPLTSSRSDVPSFLYHAPRPEPSATAKMFSVSDREREKQRYSDSAGSVAVRHERAAAEASESTPLMATNV